MEKLSPKQIRAAVMIGHGEQKKKAAKENGVSPQTISEWLQDPNFIVLVNRSKKSLLDETLDILRGNLPIAAESIRKLMTGAKSEKVRLEAAKLIIEQSNLIHPEIGYWDVGPTTAKEVRREQLKEKNPDLANFIPDHLL